MAQSNPPIWWSNAIFFILMHVYGVVGGWYIRPFRQTPLATKILCLLSWQLASFGITIGYHRLWSHRSFTARRPLRIALAIMGSLGFQGSIKWWCLRHRLHHRYTDDPVHDPYSATRGLFFSHMGWIFIKPTYERIKLVEKDDLEGDPIVRFQHKYYIPTALTFGLLTPTLLGALWGDAMGGLIWGGIVARLIIWHCTFMINSLAHWEGLQPYSDEVTAKGNFILAMFTSGEGNHNFHHAFPHDFRAGYDPRDWDPSKWIILLLHRYTSQITSLKLAKEDDVQAAARYMQKKHGHEEVEGDVYVEITDSGVDMVDGGHWDTQKIATYVREKTGRVLLLQIDGWLVDATDYAREHPGGNALLRRYAMKISDNGKITSVEGGNDASWAFLGGLNNHSRSAKAQMHRLRLGRVAGQ